MREKNNVLIEISETEKLIDKTLMEYAKYCYEFYCDSKYTFLGIDNSHLTEEQILNDDQMSDDEKTQALYFLSLPNNWESIHEKYCSILKDLYNKTQTLESELKLIEYNKEIDDTLNSINL